VNPYCSMVAVSPHNNEDRQNAKKWEHISETFFMLKFRDAQRRIAAITSAQAAAQPQS
jgi:hypothetical protein